MPWESVEPIFRPKGVHMGVMKVDAEKCTGCGLCILNCPFRAWEMGEDKVPRQKASYECFSCFNCMVACPVEAISIVENYHVTEGFWRTDPHPLPVRLPQEPHDAEGRPDRWTAVEQAVFERRSVRNFKDTPVPEPLIKRVLEAGRFAPTAGNCQPWKFIVVTNKKLIQEMNEAIYGSISTVYNMYRDNEMVKALVPLYEANPTPGTWDPRLALGGMGAIARRYGPPFLGAPVVILIAGDTRAISGPELNIGICGQNMNLVAHSLGLGACWVGFAQVLNMVPALLEKLGIKEPWRICTSLVLGYPKFKQKGVVPREFRPVTWFREGSDQPEVEV